MSSAPSSTPPSSAELAQLQQAFAADQLSDAYHPLAEGYLALGRFMEAMVVCKKGVKAHPDKAAPHILLARIYAEQNKDKKAIEELKLAVGLESENIEALRLLAAQSFKAGINAEGTEYLSKAIALDPTDTDTIALCRRHKVPVPQPAAPEPAPAPVAVSQPPMAQPMPSQPQMAPAPSQAMLPYGQQATSYPPTGLVPAPQPSMPPMPQAGFSAPPTALSPYAMPDSLAEAPTITPHAQRQRQDHMRAQQDYAALAAKYSDPDEEYRTMMKSGSVKNALFTGVAIVLVLLGLGGFLAYRKHSAERDTEIAKLLKQMQDELSHDNYASYKKVCDLGERITGDLNPDLFSAHSFLSYAYAIRWGEHGEGDRAKGPAQEHLAKAKASGQEHSYLYAAEAYIHFFQGDPEKAIRELEAKIADQDARGQNSTLLLSTLGILQTHAGSLELAINNLRKAQMAAPADSRISAWMGNAYRRQGGNDVLAANAYEQALRYEKNHAEAQLGVALMAVDAGKPETAEKYIELLLKAEPPPSNRQLALARLAYAIILDGKSKKTEADNEEQKALASDPNNGELYIMRASRQKRAGDIKGALESINKAIQLEPKRTSFQIELAETLLQQPNGAKEAVPTLEKLVQQSSNSLKLLVLLARAQMQSGALDSADKTLQKAKGKAVKNEEKAEVFIEQGNLAAYRNKTVPALEYYDEAIKAASGSNRFRAIATVQKGRLHDRNGEPKKAMEAFAEAQMYDANHAPAFFFLGLLLSENKEVKNAEIAQEQLQTYLKLAPKGEYAERAKKLLEKL